MYCEIPESDEVNNRPFTLSDSIKNEARCNGGKISSVLSVRAEMIARLVEIREPNPVVRAAFGVERAKVEMSHALPFDHSCPSAFIDGEGFADNFDPALRCRELRPAPEGPGLHPEDLKSLRNLRPRVREGCVTANWAPSHPVRVWDADPVRPPAEALALVAKQINGRVGYDEEEFLGIHEIKAPTIMCIGLGFSAAVQALSAMAPNALVRHIPVPYLFLNQGEMNRLARMNWDVVILNVPTLHAWQVGALLGGAPGMSFLQRRTIMEGRLAKNDPIAHVNALVDLTEKFRRPGTSLAVLGDPAPFHEAMRIMGDTTESLPDDMFGTDKRAVWIDWTERPWAPHNIPKPTGKIVTFRRWK